VVSHLKNPLLQAVLPAVIAGLVFLQIPDKEDRIRDRTAVIFFLAVRVLLSFSFDLPKLSSLLISPPSIPSKVFAGGFTPLMTGCFAFPSEESIIRKERRAGAYGLSAYFVAKSLADIPLQIGLTFLILPLFNSCPNPSSCSYPSVLYAIRSNFLLDGRFEFRSW
jgi:hypothetical protein